MIGSLIVMRPNLSPFVTYTTGKFDTGKQPRCLGDSSANNVSTCSHYLMATAIRKLRTLPMQCEPALMQLAGQRYEPRPKLGKA